jgi:hypothetical protein
VAPFVVEMMLAVSGGGKKVHPDYEKAGCAYLEVYFSYFLIPVSYEETDGGYEKVGKIYEQV